jgi:hypothetical protein
VKKAREHSQILPMIKDANSTDSLSVANRVSNIWANCAKKFIKPMTNIATPKPIALAIMAKLAWKIRNPISNINVFLNSSNVLVMNNTVRIRLDVG